MMKLSRLILPVSVALAAAACNDATRPAMGDEYSVIVVSADSVWAQVADTVLATLQPRIFAVRDEPTFTVSHVSPQSQDWGTLRRFRQIVAVGRPDDPWVADPLRAAGAAPAGTAIVEATDVWARNQRVTTVAVGTDDPADAVAARVDSLAAILDRRYRQWSRERMFISGVDAELSERLQTEAGFSLQMPNVYRWRQVGDSAYLFINDQPHAERLVRSLLVTWQTGTDGEPEVGPTIDWRDRAAERFYNWGQTTERDRLEATPVAGPADGGIDIRGVWVGTIEGYPQAGPFITRTVDCPAQDRRYLLDAWLYAPNRAKYQYMIQLETLLDSFACPGNP